MNKWWILKAVKIVMFLALAVLLFGFIVMQLWNFVVPALFGGPMITFVQALALLALTRILFGGLKGSWSHRGRCHKNKWQRKHYWREHMEAKMAGMTPEEKERFKQQLKARCEWWNEPENTGGEKETQ